MNIDRINGNNYPSRKIGKGNSSHGANKAKSSDGSFQISETKESTKSTANLSLSGSTFEDEITFTKNILNNSRQKSLRSLQNIKQKIRSGAYNDEKVHKKISVLISNDVGRLQHIFPPASDADNSSSISASRKKQLLEDPDIARKIAEKIAGDLQHI